MHSIHSLVKQFQKDYPELTFKLSDDFKWSPSDSTVYYDGSSVNGTPSFLHELAHALLGHSEYNRDIQLIEIESTAWHYAQAILSPRYKIPIDEEHVEDNLDTYRDWLHARSTCPQCKATGFQVKSNVYKCILCRAHWRVNDARTCALRRYKLT